jgi:hypothetical protein
MDITIDLTDHAIQRFRQRAGYGNVGVFEPDLRTLICSDRISYRDQKYCMRTMVKYGVELIGDDRLLYRELRHYRLNAVEANTIAVRYDRHIFVVRIKSHNKWLVVTYIDANLAQMSTMGIPPQAESVRLAAHVKKNTSTKSWVELMFANLFDWENAIRRVMIEGVKMKKPLAQEWVDQQEFEGENLTWFAGPLQTPPESIASPTPAEQTMVVGMKYINGCSEMWAFHVIDEPFDCAKWERERLARVLVHTKDEPVVIPSVTEAITKPAKKPVPEPLPISSISPSKFTVSVLVNGVSTQASVHRLCRDMATEEETDESWAEWLRKSSRHFVALPLLFRFEYPSLRCVESDHVQIYGIDISEHGIKEKNTLVIIMARKLVKGVYQGWKFLLERTFLSYSIQEIHEMVRDSEAAAKLNSLSQKISHGQIIVDVGSREPLIIGRGIKCLKDSEQTRGELWGFHLAIRAHQFVPIDIGRAQSLWGDRRPWDSSQHAFAIDVEDLNLPGVKTVLLHAIRDARGRLFLTKKMKVFEDSREILLGTQPQETQRNAPAA